MEPVVYDFAINERGTWADLLAGPDALMPSGYYSYIVPQLLRKGRHEVSPLRLAELDHFATACRDHPDLRGMVQTLFDSIVPRSEGNLRHAESLTAILTDHGFDRIAHEQIREDLRAGRIGLAQNRLAANAIIEDVRETDLAQAAAISGTARKLGLSALKKGEVAVVTLAAGAGSRWTQGAGVVKALHPFCKLGGRHRSFIETHLAKSRKISRECGTPLPPIFTTSYFSHDPTERFLNHYQNYHYEGPLYLSQGKSIGLRTVPTVRDLRFAWEEMPQQVLDVQQQKVRDSLRTALLHWAETTGEASDYTDNLNRSDLSDPEKVNTAIRTLASRMPTYITLKDVKKRWGHGQEDIFPVCQFEKLWVDMSNLPSLDTRYIAVPRQRGQQLKDPSQLDGWLRDGSASYLEKLCDWGGG
jgi:hypothetical protein